MDEGTDDVAYIANAKRDADELSAYFKEVRSSYNQEKERVRKEAEATASRMAKGRGKSSAPPVPEPTIPPLKGLADGIDPTKPPKNFKDAMSRPDAEEWRQAFDEEFQGFIDRGVFVPVYPRHGETIVGTTTRTEYKSEGGPFTKRKVRMCIG